MLPWSSTVISAANNTIKFSHYNGKKKEIISSCTIMGYRQAIMRSKHCLAWVFVVCREGHLIIKQLQNWPENYWQYLPHWKCRPLMLQCLGVPLIMYVPANAYLPSITTVAIYKDCIANQTTVQLFTYIYNFKVAPSK